MRVARRIVSVANCRISVLEAEQVGFRGKGRQDDLLGRVSREKRVFLRLQCAFLGRGASAEKVWE